MRVTALSLVVLIAVAAAPATGWAEKVEKVKTNQKTSLLNRPGERGKVVLSVREGQGMTVIGRTGRWLKVRVSGRTGFVPRSKVDVAELPRNSRRRSFVDGRGTDRGFTGEAGPDDRVGADALGDSARGNDPDESGREGRPKLNRDTIGKPELDDDDDDADDGGKGGDDDEVIIDEEERATARVTGKTVALAEPDEDAEESFDATPKTVLYPTGKRRGKYTEVENDEGELGYILTSKLEIDGPGGPRKRTLDLRARLGVTILSQKLRTAGGTTQIDNYDLGTSAVTLALGGAALYPYKEKYLLGGELGYDYAKAIPGIANLEGGGTTSIGLHSLRIRGMAGYDLQQKNGMAIFGRLGIHFQAYRVANVNDLMKNTTKLPEETIFAPSLGAGLMIPRVSDKIGLRFNLDTILVGASVSQTRGLEDGGTPGAKGAIIGAGLDYKWKKEMDIAVTYDLSLLSMGFGAPVASSMRGHTGTAVTRFDLFHALTVGISRGF